MIEWQRSGQYFRYRNRLFCPAPRLRDAWRLVAYFETAARARVPGFVRRSTATVLVDLRPEPEQLLEGCRKNTRYEIRRADQEGLGFSADAGPEELAAFYAAFLRSKGNPSHLRPLELDFLRALADRLAVTRARAGDEVLVMHAYVRDDEARRARLLHTASLFRDVVDDGRRAALGRANRWLHFQDMCHLRKQGIEIYDLGGYALGTSDVELLRINAFKECFGGRVVEESTYLSWPLYLLRGLTSMLVRRRSVGAGRPDTGPAPDRAPGPRKPNVP